MTELFDEQQRGIPHFIFFARTEQMNVCKRQLNTQSKESNKIRQPWKASLQDCILLPGPVLLNLVYLVELQRHI